MFNFNSKTAKSLVLAALLVLSVFGAGLAAGAAPTVDTETTNTSPTSDLTDGGTQTHNDTTSSSLGWSADSPNASVEIMQDGETLFEASPDHYSSVDTGSDGNPDLWYYNVSLADDGSDYEGLEVGADENVTLNVTLVNDTAADSPDTTNISYTYANDEETAFIASENPETEESDDGGWFSSFNVFSSESDEEEVGTVLSTDETNVTDNTSAVQLDTLNSNLTEAYAASTEDASEGDLIWASYTQVSADDGDGQYLPLFYESANEDAEWIDTDEDVYATLSEDGETMTVHNPDALLDDDESAATLSVTTVGDEQLGLGNSAAMYSNYDAGFTKTTIGAFGALDADGDPDFVTDALEA